MLTNEKRQLAEDNHLLIYKFLRERNLPVDEWYDICAIGYCQAAEAYDPGRKKSFATLAYTTMFHEVAREMYKRGAQKRNQVPLSLDVHLEDGFDPADTVADKSGKYDTPEAAEIRVCVENAIARYSIRRKAIFRDYISGRPYREIGRRHGCTYQRAQQIIREMKADIRACMADA